MQELIRTALKQNYDLQLATERINAARAQVTITRSNLFPQLQGNGNFQGGKDSTSRTTFNFLNLTADAAFQLDFFGKLRRATEASRAQLLATEDAKQTVVLTLVSDVASDYFALLQLDLQLQITRNTVEAQKASVNLTNLRMQHGVATKLEVLQAQEVLDTANAQIPDLERQIAQQENAISILLGNYPQGCRPRTPASRAAAASRSAAGHAFVVNRAPARHSPGGTSPRGGKRRNRSRQGAVLSANFPDRFRRRRVWAQQRIFRAHELASRILVLRRASDPTYFHGRSVARKFAAGGIPASAGVDSLTGKRFSVPSGMYPMP